MISKGFYNYLKVIFNITIPTYYRKITIKNRGKVVKGKPTLIAMNHPNAFMDPIAFAAQVHPPMHFIARGDAFKKGIKPFLEAVGIIPIYRFIDFGREGMAMNDETFKQVNAHLKKKDHIIIFPEGLCIQERRLRPLKKGLARMVFTSYEDLKDDEIKILPVAMNYQNNPSKFRHTLFINVGEEIYIKDYINAYRENNAKAVTQLTQLIQQRMKDLLVHIDNKENDELVEGIEEIYLDEGLEKNGTDKLNLEERHKLTKKIVSGVNQLDKEKPEETIALKTEIKSYLTELRKLGIRDKLLRDDYKSKSTIGSLLLRSLLFMIGLPFWIFGLLTNYIPYFISWKLTKKITKNIEWFSAVSMLIGSFLYQFWYIIQFLVVWFIFKDWKILIAFITLTIFCGWMSLHFSPFRKKLLGSWRMFGIKRNESLYDRLIKKRNALVTAIKSLPA